mmetsp:Transcript_67311/g.161371  ORF Transcript_67311/g.161371 Transcript_67311/m.161371 type:complete len:876 (-) Transcript_67311:58-2685(-)
MEGKARLPLLPGAVPLPPNAWPRPLPGCEPSRRDSPLELLYQRSSLPAESWRPVIVDEDWRCFSFLAPKAVTPDRSQYFKNRLLETAPWVELKNTKGTSVTRSTCWYARGGCTCTYTYGRDLRMGNSSASQGSTSCPIPGAADVPPPEDTNIDFRNVMAEIMEHVFNGVFQGFSEEEWPNSANVNLYKDGRQAVGWHADDESLFKGREADCPIVSLSLGASREFWVALKREGSMEPDPRTTVEVDLQDGDILTMEGRLQRHCLHLVPKANPRAPIREERINITFRWVREHKAHCPLRRVKEARLPRSLGGIFGEVGMNIYGFPQIPSLFREAYVRSWSCEVAPGYLANCYHSEWRLCDGCKHVCFEEGRACCEGTGEWSGLWFCRQCWSQWAPNLSGDLPSGPLEVYPSQPYMDPYGYAQTPSQDYSWWGACPPLPLTMESASAYHHLAQAQQNQQNPYWGPLTQHFGAGVADGRRLLQPQGQMAGCLSTSPPPKPALPPDLVIADSQALPTRYDVCSSSAAGPGSSPIVRASLSAGSTAIPSASSGSMSPRGDGKDGVDAEFADTVPSQQADLPAPSPLPPPPAEPPVIPQSPISSPEPPRRRKGIDELLERASVPSTDCCSLQQAVDAAALARVNDHCLDKRWALWVLLVRESLDWSEAQAVVHDEISSVEELWRVLQHIHLPSSLVDADYSVFLEGITPAREDERVQNGGRWILALQSGGSQRGALPAARFHDVVDKVWLETVLAVLGGTLEEAIAEGSATATDEPLSCGIVISMRGCDKDALSSGQDVPKQKPLTAKLALWLRGAQSRDQVRAAGNALLKVLSSATSAADDVPRGGWRLAFEDFATRSVTSRLSLPMGDAHPQTEAAKQAE